MSELHKKIQKILTDFKVESIENEALLHTIKSLYHEGQYKAINEYHEDIKGVFYEAQEKASASKNYGVSDEIRTN